MVFQAILLYNGSYNKIYERGFFMLQLAVFLPVIAMFFVPFLRKSFKKIHTGKFVIIVPLILFLYFLSNLKYIYSGGIIYKTLAFASNVGLDINLMAYHFCLLF